MTVTYMNGAGNDFMVIDARGQTLDFEALAKKLCKLTNADGSRGEMCGNGARCICRYAFDHGIAGESMVVETDAGLVPGKRLSESQYRVKLNNPGVLDLHRKGDIA